MLRSHTRVNYRPIELALLEIGTGIITMGPVVATAPMVHPD